jgi:hypothetical protein
MTRDRGARWLAVVVAALLATHSAAAGEVLTEPRGADRRQIAEQLVEIGRAPDQAAEAAGRLTAADLEVLLAHPEMMQAAGGLEMTVGVLVVIGVIVGLAIAGSTVVIISV